ncbi:MAG TPA: hypothetical protein VGF34_16945 [Stellaceae bacterium]|jgi:hypothetical protein
MKALLFGSASLIALALGARAVLRGKAAGKPPPPHPSEQSSRTLTRRYLQYFLVPLWLAAGIADWTRHRATHIETTTGAKETLIHLLMLAEMGVPVLAGLLLEINAPVLALMYAAFFVHEGTALWDVEYAVTRREVTPVEQHIHSFLEMLPLMAAGTISVLHWPALKALLGLARDPEPEIRRKREPLPLRYVGATLGAIVLLEILPYLEELWRDWQANPGRLVPPEQERLAAIGPG